MSKPAPIYITARNYKNYDRHSLWKILHKLIGPEYPYSHIDDCNEKVDNFNLCFQNVLNKHAPLKSMKIRYRQYPFVRQDLKQHMS